MHDLCVLYLWAQQSKFVCLFVFSTQSSGTIGIIVGSLFAWPISEVLGRKSVLIIGGFPAFFGWILIVFSVYIVNNIQGFIAILLTGRLLTGVATGMTVGGVAVSAVGYTSHSKPPPSPPCTFQ